MLGASLNEVGLVALFVAVVLIASKVGKIGEAVGGLFECGGEASAREGSREAPREAPSEGPGDDESKPEGP